MTASGTAEAASAVLLDARALPELSECASLANLVASGAGRVHAGGLWGGSQALVLAHLAARGHLGDRSALVVLASDGEAEAFATDLAQFGVEALAFPSREGADGGATLARGFKSAGEGERGRICAVRARARARRGVPRGTRAGTRAATREPAGEARARTAEGFQEQDPRREGGKG